MPEQFDAVVVGSGPNGLSAGIVLARAGLSVLLVEAKETLGGASRTEELTLPGFRHDICSAIHPTALASPFFNSIGLDQKVEWIHPPVALAHPLDGGRAGVLEQSLESTRNRLGADGARWERVLRPLLEKAGELNREILRPIRFPSHPLLMARFARNALRSCHSFVKRFSTDEARALFGGCAAHGVVPLERAGTASFGIVLALGAHAFGWPLARGGSAVIVEALASIYREAGGEIRTGLEVKSLAELPPARAYLFDLTPHQMLRIAGTRFSPSYRKRLQRYRYGPGVFKIDWALSGPVPWINEACRRSGTVHVCGPFEDIAASERAAWDGRTDARPFVLFVQQSLFDRSRAPAGKQTGWAYCHVPNGSAIDMTGAIERQIERFAPGFRDLILARATIQASEYESHDANIVGGDIGGGANTLFQFLARPFPKLDPYATDDPRVFVCSSATPPGGGVHGMCGYWAARSVLRSAFHVRSDKG